jgi:hypothetical protein
MAVDGTRPKIKRIRDFLESESVDPSKRRQLLAYIDRSNDEGHGTIAAPPSFLPMVFRQIVLKNDDPTDFVAEVTVDAAGNPAGTDRGSDLEALFGPASQ